MNDRNTRVWLLSLLLATGCGTETQSESAKVKKNAWELSVKEISNVERRSSEGDADAYVDLAQHYFYLSGRSNENIAIGYLQRGVENGSYEAVNLMVVHYLARGDCVAADKALQKFNGVTKVKLTNLKALIVDIERCYDRPIGQGDWTTRRANGVGVE